MGKLEVRTGLKELDRCLYALEDVNERGEPVVSSRLAYQLQRHIPTVVEGLPVSAALNMVFLEQARVQADTKHQPGAPARNQQAVMTVDEARFITLRIRNHSEQAAALLLEAHDREAWRSLGHKSWSAYVRQELGISRSRSYELLEQARVVKALQVGIGRPMPIQLTPYAAMAIKPQVDKVVDAVRRQIQASTTPAELTSIVTDVVNAVRARSGPKRKAKLDDQRAVEVAISASTSSADSRRVNEIVLYLAELPSPSDWLTLLTAPQLPGPEVIRRAANWLLQLGEVVSAIQSPGADAYRLNSLEQASLDRAHLRATQPASAQGSVAVT